MDGAELGGGDFQTTGHQSTLFFSMQGTIRIHASMQDAHNDEISARNPVEHDVQSLNDTSISNHQLVRARPSSGEPASSANLRSSASTQRRICASPHMTRV